MTNELFTRCDNDSGTKTGAKVGCIRHVVRDDYALISIDNPSRHNALTPQMCDEIISTVNACEADPRVKAIAITGVGADFCAGADISELSRVLFDNSENGNASNKLDDHLSAADNAIAAARKPTFAVVRGVCMGGGWQIASACDVVLAADTVRIAITPAKLGIIYPRRGVERLIRMVGADRAKYLLFSGEEISAATAYAWGLVTDLIPEDIFAASVERILHTTTERSQFSIHTMKALIDATINQASDLDERWSQAWDDTVSNQDHEIGQQAFLARERPVFTWTPR